MSDELGPGGKDLGQTGSADVMVAVDWNVTVGTVKKSTATTDFMGLRRKAIQRWPPGAVCHGWYF